MYAIIKTGGKQYMVNEGDVLEVEKLNANEGDTVEVEVLAVSNDGDVKAGEAVKSAKVVAKVVEHGKGKKIIVFKYKAKKDYRRKKGHRQPFTKIQIEKIEA
ncbi:50S ribosomal protein L21 [Criibacterium bergeronii]|uniref:Large ribosomal subunit protein bL21 n=1 Tax=Criibacterium bergeronii TaxID=1871336 RepID=A0A552V959_9FIRM|nr:50S ribosomal protein L21 [Criibacterium bergeronii]TRW27013.1 50S ribosomal protein L21 [Criibacterium bergeronii]